MGLFGALFAGVSGLNSQSNKIGVISNNISNANTVGYKQGVAGFNTLVVPSGQNSFSPGGVLGGNEQLVNQQGLIQATTSATDVAISGNGLMVVNTKTDGTGNTYYTRAGSFTQDALGNFVNANGYYLQGFPLNGTDTPSSTNFSNLKTVNVSSNAIGQATATSTITLDANFNADQKTLLGYTETASIFAGGLDPTNASNSGADVIIPNSGNQLVRGTSFSITSGGVNSTVNFTYGNFSQGRDVTNNGATGEGDGGHLLLTSGNTPTPTNISVVTSGAVTLTFSPATLAQDFATGGSVTLAGSGAVGGLSAANINGQHTVASINTVAGTVTFQSSGTGFGSAVPAASVLTTNRTDFFAGNILDASTASQNFLSQTPDTSFTAAALKFTATVAGTTYTFTYNGSPNAAQGQFNSMTSLVTAINSSTNGSLQANVGADNRLYISAVNPNQAVTYQNGDAVGNGISGTGALNGINWMQELDLPAANTPNVNAGANASANPPQYYFNSLNSLAYQINASDPTNLTATVLNPTGQASLTISEANPLQTITFADSSSTIAGGSLLAELGLQNPGHQALGALPTVGTYAQYTTSALPVTYNPTDASNNMSSGKVAAQFSKDITIYDAQGNSHQIALNVAKLGIDTWAVEITAVPATDVTGGNSLNNGTKATDGQLAHGILKFANDGTSPAVQPGSNLLNPITANWTNGAGFNTFSFTDSLQGLTQSASASGVSVANQNGSPVGQLTGVSIDANGYVVASFSNGQTQKMFQVPLANVNNPNGLEAVSGDAFKQTNESGEANLALAGTNGVGTFSTSALEQSNVDISTQLTNLIVAQQAYGANSKVLTIADQLLQQLDQIIQ